MNHYQTITSRFFAPRAQKNDQTAGGKVPGFCPFGGEDLHFVLPVVAECVFRASANRWRAGPGYAARTLERLRSSSLATKTFHFSMPSRFPACRSTARSSSSSRPVTRDFGCGLNFLNLKRKRAYGRRAKSRLLSAETIRQPRDRLRGQPQERQHSAAAGGTRDRLPPARGAKYLARGIVTRRAETHQDRGSGSAANRARPTARPAVHVMMRK